MNSPFELVLDCRCRLAESPVWWAERGLLLFVDISGRRLYRFKPGSRAADSVAIDEDIGCVAPTTGAGFIAGLRSGLWLLNERGEKVRLLAANPEDPTVSRFNDGRVDPKGRFLAGTIDEPKDGGSAALYRYDRRGLAKIAAGLLTSNGLAFSPDGGTLYHSDTPRFLINRYDYDAATGTAENPRVFAQLEPTATDRGRPDGAAVDAEGCYWSALYEGGRIRRYDPRGTLMSDYAMPVRSPTMPAFGGAQLKTLFVTSARDADGAGGGLYAMRVEVPGLPNFLFDTTEMAAP